MTSLTRLYLISPPNAVIPAQAGIQRAASAAHMDSIPRQSVFVGLRRDKRRFSWIPAFAGMTWL